MTERPPIGPAGSARPAPRHSPGLKRLGERAWFVTTPLGGQAVLFDHGSGLSVVDGGATMDASAEVMGTFRLTSDTPVSEIIYTSGEAASYGGADAIAGADGPRVFASSKFAPDTETRGDNAPSLARARDLRKLRQTGRGAGEIANRDTGRGRLPVTDPVPDTGCTIRGDSETLHLFQTPATRRDQITIYGETSGIVVTNLCFNDPALWADALLDLPGPDFASWAEGLDRILAFDPRCLVSTRGSSAVLDDTLREVLRDMRDAMTHVVAEVSLGLTRGRTIAQVADLLTLPAPLDGKPHLMPLRQKLGWVARAIGARSVGWFDGNPTTLNPLPAAEEAQRMISLAGGEDAVLRAAEEADSPQWALELCDRLILAGHHVSQARNLKAACLHVRAENESDPKVRNYYLSHARDIDLEG